MPRRKRKLPNQIAGRPLVAGIPGAHRTVRCYTGLSGEPADREVFQLPCEEGNDSPWGYKRGPWAPLPEHQAFQEHTTTMRLRDHAVL
jgi:hypothetical protein